MAGAKHVKRSIPLLAAIMMLFAAPAFAQPVTTGNGTLVYSPDPAVAFDPAGTTYARIVTLKHNGPHNGTLLLTYDQLVKRQGRQVYPIYRSTDNGASWTLIANVADERFGTTRTSQPMLFELPRQAGDLPAGTLLLAGNIFPENKSSTRIVIWRSADRGMTWSYWSTVDTGGPYRYDPSPQSTTTSIWEPFLYLDSKGDLVCAYSDERQKSDNVLQALVLRKSSDGGKTWGSLVNVTAIPNKNDRPGMITVTKLPNNTYIAAYEVVNRPGLSLNSAEVYCKFSVDGVTWDAADLGTPIKLSDGRGIGSGPYVKWVPAGGPNGTVIVSSKWALDRTGHISGGQNFYANDQLGRGYWEKLPYAVTYDAEDCVGYFSGYSQSFDTSMDELSLFQATNVENLSTGMDEIRVGARPLGSIRYEAEQAVVRNAEIVDQVDATAGKEVGMMTNPDSSVTFAHITAAASGVYRINVRYSNGIQVLANHLVTVNDGPAFRLDYPRTVGWKRYGWASFAVKLHAGNNVIQFAKGASYVKLDCIEVYT